MNNFIKTSYATSTVIFILYLSAFWCNGEEVETVGAPMEKREKEALYSAIQGFVGKWWNGSDLYPDPCGWTPIQVLLPSFLFLFSFPYINVLGIRLCILF